MNFQSLTFHSIGIARSIIIPVLVSQSKEICKEFNIETKEADVMALIDTGATNSSISDKLANSIGMKAVDQCKVAAAGGIHTANVFLIDISLKNMINFNNIRSAGFFGNDAFDIIIGMDILTQGDLAITNHDRQTVLSFRIPPDNKHIDFTI
ncbi:MAG: retroviral-like aspartic protease family protein [Treponema sp.]|nr:retroviral-like aspartic protease family protein [Treponema sp.]MCL2252117.1 retroviral-like aspartic protease family protein [Treponema sp.]